MIITIISILLLTAGTVLSFFYASYGTVVAFLGLCVTGLVPGVSLSVPTYLFWGLAMLIVVSLNFILPEKVSRSRLGVPYMCGASLAGALVGLTMSHAAMIIGAVAGAVLGGIAYAKTPEGKQLMFPSSKFLNYLCAKGLPAVIAVCITGTAAGLLAAVWSGN